MTWSMKAESGGVELEPGAHRVRVLDTELVEYEDSKFGKGTRKCIKFSFELPDDVDDGGDTVKLTVTKTAKLTPYHDLWGWITALTGVEPEMDGEFKGECLTGAEALAVTAMEADAKGVMWCKIKALTALPTAMKSSVEPSPGGEAGSFEPSPQATPGPPVDPWEDLRAKNGDVDWTKFSAFLKQEGVQPGDIADYLGVPKVDRVTIREWAEGGGGRTAKGLILETARYMREKQVDPDDLPFK